MNEYNRNWKMLMSGHHSLLLRKERAIRFPAAFVLFTRWFLLHGGDDDIRIVRPFLSFWRDSLCLVIPFLSNIQSWKKPHKEWTMKWSRWFWVECCKKKAGRWTFISNRGGSSRGRQSAPRAHPYNCLRWSHAGKILKKIIFSDPCLQTNEVKQSPRVEGSKILWRFPSLQRELQKKDTWI